MPKVSVIIPVYGVEKYIERCVRSLFEQTLDDIEFIFVDDCTPDKSMEILESIIEEYRLLLIEKNFCVRIERMPTNSGLPAVRRHGIQCATSDYIIHCDSDDWVDADLYKQLYEKADTEKADIVICDYKETNGNEIIITRKGLLSREKERCIKDMMYKRTSWSLCNKLIKKNLYRHISEYPKYYMGEDMALVLPVMLTSACIAYCPNIYYNYFINPESPSRKKSLTDAIRKYKSVECNLDIVRRKCTCIADNTYSKAINYITFFNKEQLLLPYRKDNEIKALIDKDFYITILQVIIDTELGLKVKLKAFAMIILKIFNQI